MSRMVPSLSVQTNHQTLNKPIVFCLPYSHIGSEGVKGGPIPKLHSTLKCYFAHDSVKKEGNGLMVLT